MQNRLGKSQDRGMESGADPAPRIGQMVSGFLFLLPEIAQS